MKLEKIQNACMVLEGIKTKKEIAEQMGETAPNLHVTIKKQTIRLHRLIKLAKLMGCSVVIRHDKTNSIFKM